MSTMNKKVLGTLILAGAIGLEGAVGRALAGQAGVRIATREEVEAARRREAEEIRRYASWLERHVAELRRGDNNPNGRAATRRLRQQRGGRA